MKISRSCSMMVGFLLLYGTTGCIQLPAAKFGGVAAPPPSPSQIAACQKTRTWHNIWTMSGVIWGALSGAGGGLESLTSDKTAQTGIAIAAAGAGVLALISTTAAGFDADSFSQNNCQDILSAAQSAGMLSPKK